jgi:hypothetical protein
MQTFMHGAKLARSQDHPAQKAVQQMLPSGLRLRLQRNGVSAARKVTRYELR